MPARFPVDPGPGRRHPVHGVRIDLSAPTIVFLTVCTKDRKPWLTEASVQASLVEIWRHHATAWLVGDYLLMPDHLHLFCVPNHFHVTLEHWVRYWKSIFCRCHSRGGYRWQTDFWDTRLRSREQLSEKWRYVQGNPERQGHVTRLEDWPFKGRVHDFMV